MGAAGVKKNFTKFQVLSTIIPPHVMNEVKPLLRMQATDFPANDAYKQLKQRILRIFGPRPEAAVERALNRTLIGKPSQLARALVEDICKKQLDCECCPSIVMALWKRHLPSSVRAGIAKYKLTKENFNEVTELADDIHENTSTVASISVGAVQKDMDETLPAIPYATAEVAATSANQRGRGRGRGRGGNRGRGRGGAQASQGAQAQPRHKGTKHPDLPAGQWTGCQMHFRWGRRAHFCTEPLTCPWKNVIAAKSDDK